MCHHRIAPWIDYKKYIICKYIKLTRKYDRVDSHVLIFLTVLSLKCGSSDLRARLADVKCENNFAYRNLCLNARSATASKKNTKPLSANRNIQVRKFVVISLKVKSRNVPLHWSSINKFYRDIWTKIKTFRSYFGMTLYQLYKVKIKQDYKANLHYGAKH